MDKWYPHHAFFQAGCDPNNLPIESPFTFGLSRGPFTVHRNCFLRKDLLSYSIDYTKQFFDTYKQKRKYYSLRIIDGHEATGELGNEVVDPLLLEFFEYMDN